MTEQEEFDDEEQGASLATVPRLMVFPDRPDCLVLYLPKGMAVRLPALRSPFAKRDVADACGEAGLSVRVSDGTPGKWGAAYRSLHKAEVAERNQRHRLAEAAKNAERRGSDIQAATSRAEALAQKNEIDEQIRALKVKIGEARGRAYTRGAYLPAETYRNLEKRLASLKEESQALQVRLGELREEEKRARAERESTYADRFMKIANAVLPEDVLQRIYGQLQEDEGDFQEDGQ